MTMFTTTIKDQTLSPEQKTVVDGICDWHRAFHSKRFYVCGGLAGCVLADTKIKIRKKSGKKNIHSIKQLNPKPARPSNI